MLSAPVHGAVLINEFVYDPAGTDSGNEWIELYNTGSSTVSLEGWTIQIDANAFPGTTKATLCGSIPPAGYYLIKEAQETISTATVADLISGTLGLGNASSKADGIQLLNAEGTVQDRVVYGTADSDNLCAGNCTLAPAATNGSSVSRSTPGASNFVAVSASSVTPVSGGGLCVAGGCPSGSGIIRGLITEVAPSVSSTQGGDFVEIFISEGTNLCGVRLFESDALVKTFPSVTPKSSPFGSFIIFNAGTKVSAGNPDETNSTGDTDFDTAIDLYSDETSPGISGSANNNLTLKNSDGTIVDFVSWSLNTDSAYSAAKQTQYDNAVSTGKWTPSCGGDLNCYIAASVSWSNKSTESMSRRIGSNGSPQDSNPSGSGDWTIGTPTPGRGYGSTIQPQGKMLEIFQSPFSPFGDGRFTEAVIGYKVVKDSIVTIQVYDTQGRLVRTLLDSVKSNSNETQTVIWSGKDSESRNAPIGIYIVHIEVLNPDGATEKDSKTVVVGRKL